VTERAKLGQGAYRADIDGLRAVAVASVVLFHLHVRGFGGGYVGVDVFFVISGYLITGLLRKDIERGALSLKTFYLRRIRRLAPALLATSLVTSLMSWLLLYPEDMSSFAASLTLQPLSLQNFFFLADGEYFRGAEAKPLLHTWSLAVEEQFYLFWPLLLLLASRLSSRGRGVLFATLALGSFALNLALFHVSPKASFFLLPSRAWELGLGAAVALLEERRVLAGFLTQGRRSAAAATGFLAIAVAVASFSDSTPFPGVAALLPVIGSALLLLAGAGDSHALTRWLASPPLVRLGLISYPLYLWHWPVLVCLRYGHRFPATSLGTLGIVGISALLAELTYRYVETPIRKGKALRSPSALVGTSAAAALALAVFGIHTWASDGAAYRYSGIARALLTAPFHARTERCGIMFRTRHPLAPVCPLVDDARPTRKILLWGNSHADQWSGALAQLAEQHHASLYLNARNCRATADSSFCDKDVQQAVLSYASQHGITDVVLASSWYGRYHVTDETFERELASVVSDLARRKMRAWLVIDTPTGAELDPITAFEAHRASPEFGAVPAEPQRLRRESERDLFLKLAAMNPHGMVTALDPSEELCGAGNCPGGHAGVAWYRDAEHLTDDGATVASRGFSAVFDGAALVGE